VVAAEIIDVIGGALHSIRIRVGLVDRRDFVQQVVKLLLVRVALLPDTGSGHLLAEPAVISLLNMSSNNLPLVSVESEFLTLVRAFLHLGELRTKDFFRDG